MAEIEEQVALGGITISSRLRAWWLNKLDNDSVRAWVPHYNAAWLLWSVLATFMLPPVSTLYDAMHPVGYYMWVWLGIPANLLPIIGLYITNGGSSVQTMEAVTEKMANREWYGLFMQATGHFVASVLLLMFEVSVIITIFSYDGPAVFAGMTVFAGFMLAPWTEGCPLLFAQCLRKVQIALRKEREGMLA